ncbi:MAG: hypothetical protein EOP39_09025 [Rubrivivax sp.]|nr:MAG: hypothetical protein EOP39_09025 [Rubrivivax sp.]
MSLPLRLSPCWLPIALASSASLNATTTAVLHTGRNALVVRTAYPIVKTYEGSRPFRADECLQLKFSDSLLPDRLV